MNDIEREKIIGFCECDFCNEIQNQANNTFIDIYGKLNIKTRVVGENDMFVVIPTIGQLFKYSLSILPKQHIESMSQLDKAGIASLIDILEKTKKKLSVYGKVVVFEHGAHKETGGSCGIYHAHIHIISLPSELDLSSLFHPDSFINKYDNLYECYSDLKESSQYLMIINADNSLFAVDTTSKPSQYSSQFFRKKLAEYYKLNKPWDWREYLLPEQEVLQTIKEIRL
ncbi:MAG: HIT domain-containing protein [Firmicutes bacterium]|nr:HIT domain-containing protein [Bacillota bacterium]